MRMREISQAIINVVDENAVAAGQWQGSACQELLMSGGESGSSARSGLRDVAAIQCPLPQAPLAYAIPNSCSGVQVLTCLCHHASPAR